MKDLDLSLSQLGITSGALLKISPGTVLNEGKIQLQISFV